MTKCQKRNTTIEVDSVTYARNDETYLAYVVAEGWIQSYTMSSDLKKAIEGAHLYAENRFDEYNIVVHQRKIADHFTLSNEGLVFSESFRKSTP